MVGAHVTMAMEFHHRHDHAMMGIMGMDMVRGVATSADVITTFAKTTVQVAPSCNDQYHDHGHDYINTDKTCSV
ncbi:hypothetical protein CDL12_08710 [Handroanthus impetiginosus]|uniref:Uncharacterized protein n=1 Tax=Handroanthus impetiginosus TaxID=429701 RepID=A0A2G9HM66_9LAMI|nr:hypothetical protein CDL12_08710 [Handroanthus impetiginosus]